MARTHPTSSDHDASRDAKALMAYDANKKSMLLAYILWFFLGTLGIHRFYLGRIGSALTILALTIIGGATYLIAIGYIFLFIVGVWLLIDIFLIPGMVRAHNNDLAAALSED